jgi:hypothetical protein
VPITPFTIHAIAGNTFKPTISLTEDDEVTPIDLTEGSVEWALRAGSVTEQWVDAPQASITNGAGGVISLSLSADQTRLLYAVSPNWRYEVTITLFDYRQTVLTGSFVIGQEVVA